MTFGLMLSRWELPNRKAEKVKPNVSPAFLFFFQGVGESRFCVFQFEPHAFQPFLDGLFASLYTFPRVVEDDKVVGVSDAVYVVFDPLPSYHYRCGSSRLLHYVFKAMKRNVG